MTMLTAGFRWHPDRWMMDSTSTVAARPADPAASDAEEALDAVVLPVHDDGAQHGEGQHERPEECWNQPSDR